MNDEQTRLCLSGGQFSVDDQIADVISYLSNDERFASLMEGSFLSEYPEYNTLVWEASWVDWEASDVDPSYMAWVADWIEANTPVYWEDGEPWIDDDEPQPM